MQLAVGLTFLFCFWFLFRVNVHRHVSVALKTFSFRCLTMNCFYFVLFFPMFSSSFYHHFLISFFRLTPWCLSQLNSVKIRWRATPDYEILNEITFLNYHSLVAANVSRFLSTGNDKLQFEWHQSSYNWCRGKNVIIPCASLNGPNEMDPKQKHVNFSFSLVFAQFFPISRWFSTTLSLFSPPDAIASSDISVRLQFIYFLVFFACLPRRPSNCFQLKIKWNTKQMSDCRLQCDSIDLVALIAFEINRRHFYVGEWRVCVLIVVSHFLFENHKTK